MPRFFSIALSLVICASGPAVCRSQDVPQPVKPEKEHEWLQQLIGEWESVATAASAPGEPEFECHGTEKIHGLGSLWIVSEGEASAMGMTVKSMMTLGYDSQKQKFVGSWVDTMFNYMWTYEGTLDESGKVLTLLTEGPGFSNPAEKAKYKEVLELKDKDHKVFTSYVQTEDGEWMKFVTVTAKRIK